MKCCEITLGMLNQRATIKRKVRAPNGAGGYDVSLEVFAQVYCNIKPLNGTEKMMHSRLESHGMSKVIMHYRPDILESMVFEHRGVQYNIRSVVNAEMADRYLELIIERGAAV